MSIYNDKINNGEFYVRKIDGTIDTSNSFLSSIYIKYKDIDSNFYDYLSDNRIKNIDVFYDVFYIETDVGYIFEKFMVDMDNIVYPFLNDNHFTKIINTSPCYWFDDKELKIYIVDVISGYQEILSFNFFIILKEFDCKSGKMQTILKEQIIFNCSNSSNWGNSIPIIEKPTISYNQSTNKFNLSFIFRNNNKEIGIISVNFLKKINIELDEINLFSEFLNVSQTYHISY
jgi:hypothetical protein